VFGLNHFIHSCAQLNSFRKLSSKNRHNRMRPRWSLSRPRKPSSRLVPLLNTSFASSAGSRFSRSSWEPTDLETLSCATGEHTHDHYDRSHKQASWMPTGVVLLGSPFGSLVAVKGPRCCTKTLPVLFRCSGRTKNLSWAVDAVDRGAVRSDRILDRSEVFLSKNLDCKRG
jgi:hypothetical protein